MKFSRFPRFGAIAGPMVAGALVLAACGGSDGSGATQSTVDLSQASTAFVVRPPSSTVPGATVDGVAVSVEGAQDYVIQAGDYPLKLADDFGVSVADIVEVNGWGSAEEFPGIGETIKIPGSATAVVEVSNEEGDSAAVVVQGNGDGNPEVTVVTIPDSGDNCAEGKYTIEGGDFEQIVADKFSVSLEALRSANSDTSGYGAFFPGLVIVIPAKTDC